VLGPVDPQVGQYAAASIIHAVERKTDINKVDDETLILADVARKARDQVRDFVYQLLSSRGMAEDQADKLATTLSEGRWTHDFPITVEAARELGMNVSTDLPAEVRELLALYPQPRGRRTPSVQYIPAPYGPRRGSARQNERN
jgi:ClpP class serine protease